MNKKIILLVSFLAFFMCTYKAVDCSASNVSYVITTTPKLIMKKGTKVKMIYHKSWKKVKWISSNNEIVKVSKKGTVTAKKRGKAIIKVINKNGKTVKCKIAVKKKIKKATKKNVTVKIKQVNEGGIRYTIVNNSDENLVLYRTYVESVSTNITLDSTDKTPGDSGENTENKPAIGVSSLVYISPRSKHNGEYAISFSEKKSGEYKLGFMMSTHRKTKPKLIRFTVFNTFTFQNS